MVIVGEKNLFCKQKIGYLLTSSLLSGSSLENNKQAGIHHNPTLTAYQQRELAGWFKFPDDLNIQYSSYKPILIPQHYIDIHLEVGETKYFLTQRVRYDPIDRNFNIYVSNV
jgi:hypothetical protein